MFSAGGNLAVAHEVPLGAGLCSLEAEQLSLLLWHRTHGLMTQNFHCLHTGTWQQPLAELSRLGFRPEVWQDFWDAPRNRSKVRCVSYPLLHCVFWGKLSNTFLFKWRRIASFGKKSELSGSWSFSGGGFLSQVGTGEQCVCLIGQRTNPLCI